MSKTFVGFGFGPIQSGLFLYEAFRSGSFNRLAVAEVAGDVVHALRQSGGKYTINIAERNGISARVITGLEIYNPTEAADRAQLVAAIAESAEVATALPAVEYFDRGDPSPARLLAAGLVKRMQASQSHNSLIYTAENHIRAAEILQDCVRAQLPADCHSWFGEHVQFVNTVIGKMSGVVDSADEIARAHLRPLVEGSTRAVLVEEFNHILIERVRLPDFTRGISVFAEKVNLRPFEEAKLYGHNAAHALMGYLAQRRGYQVMSEVRNTELMDLVTRAFVEESGVALCRRHDNIDELFTQAGWRSYATDLLERMTNPHLRDKVSRIVRDPARKLGWNDRLIGTMRMALKYGVEPHHYARGAAAALAVLSDRRPAEDPSQVLQECWGNLDDAVPDKHVVTRLVMQAFENL